jgi:adenylate kinase family enzyme
MVGGISGSGKTTLAKAIAVRRGLPYHEMDALAHGPQWARRPSFDADVAAVAAQDEWVFDSHGYSSNRDLLWSRADTLVWLDYPRRVVMARVVRRSLRRATGREQLWAGNTESFLDWRQPDHPIRWAWTQHAGRAADIAARIADPSYQQVTVVHLRSPRQARAWLASLPTVFSRG